MQSMNSEQHVLLSQLVKITGKKRHRGQVPKTRRLMKKYVKSLQQKALPLKIEIRLGVED